MTMQQSSKTFARLLGAALVAAPLCLFSGAAAADAVVSCADGRDHLFQPRVVTAGGAVVTAALVPERRRGIRTRLVPMGDGYRYAARGVWLTGKRNVAELTTWPSASACTVE